MPLLQRLAVASRSHSRILHRTLHSNVDRVAAVHPVSATNAKLPFLDNTLHLRPPLSRLATPPTAGLASLSTASEALPEPRNPYSRSHHERRTVPFSPSELYQVVANVDEYHQFVPWCTDSRVTQRLDDGLVIADLSVGFRFLNEKYTSVITLDENRSVSADVPHSGLFDYLITDWTFRPAPNGSTELTFYVEFAFRNPVYQRVTNLFFEEVVRRMVTAFEHQCVRKYNAPEQNRVVGMFRRW